MFRSDNQISEVVIALWDNSAKLRGLWTHEGPSPRARTHKRSKRARKGYCSSDHVLLDLGWALWNYQSKCLFGDALRCLDNRNLRNLGSLLVALAEGPEAIDRWLEARKAAA